MAAIVPDPSSSSLCTADLLLIKPPRHFFLPFHLFLFTAFRKWSQTLQFASGRIDSPTRSLLLGATIVDAVLPRLGKTEDALFREYRLRAIRPFKEEIFPVDRCLPRGSSGLLSGQTIARLLFDTIV